MNIWITVAIAITVVLACILWLRLHAFLALTLAGFLVALLTPQSSLEDYAKTQMEKSKSPWTQAQADSFVKNNANAPKRIALSFGEYAGKIGILIALASVIGSCLMHSGAAAVIIKRMLALVGEAKAAYALTAGSFVLGIPVFFDTVFYLMVPLAKSLHRQVGKNYVLFILAILAGGSLAHSLVPPTPGPLTVASELNIDILDMMLGGLAICCCSSVLSLTAASLINRFVEVPVRDFEDDKQDAEATLENVQGPPLGLSLLPILLPVLLIAGGTAWKMWQDSESAAPPAANAIAAADDAQTNGANDEGLGQTDGSSVEASRSSAVVAIGDIIKLVSDKNVALGIAAALAIFLLRWAPVDASRGDLISKALSSGGVIILITCAGGAFGAMLRYGGIAKAVGDLTGDLPGLALLVIAFLVTASIRTLQGSSTVAMITAAGVLQGFADPVTLPYHPVYLATAIGAGSKPVAWMTDSGFWVICKMSGMTESEGLRTVTPMSIAMGLSGLLFTVLGAWLLPFNN